MVAAGLLKMSELKCAKKCLNKEAILATVLHMLIMEKHSTSKEKYKTALRDA